MGSQTCSRAKTARRLLSLTLASLLVAASASPLPALGASSLTSSETSEPIEIESSPLFANSLSSTVATLDGEGRSEQLKATDESAREPHVKLAPLVITMDYTCLATCGTTCNYTCVGTSTCGYTCDYTCNVTCNDYTCAGTTTCSTTCAGNTTCSYTCSGTYTCYTTCIGTTTCSSTCGTTCDGTTCTTTCGTTCDGTTCSTTCGTTCGTTCDGATCDVTCEGVTCGATCGTDCDPSAVPFFENGLEVWPGPWTTSAEAGPTWGSTSYRKSEGSASAYCAGSTIAAPGPYANSMNAWLTAGPFDLTDHVRPTLVFDLWIDTEEDFDTLWAGASVNDLDYDMAGWSGTSDGWMTVEVDLSDVLGDGTVDLTGQPEVWISFLFESDDSVYTEGAYVDNVRLMSLEGSTLEDGCTRLAGATRYETSIKASQEGFPSGASTVVLATGENWPDALGGSALAGAVSGPLLLTHPTILRDDVKAELERLGATGVYILGGTGAVSPGVESALRTLLGDSNVKRLQGIDRYATAARIAEETIAVLGNSYSGAVFVATGANFPDATAAAPLAAALERPILLAHPTKPYDQAVILPPEAVSAFILGGTGAVSSGVEAALGSELTGAVERLAGANRYQTAALIAAHGVDEGMHWNGVGLATGENFPDALSGGAMLGRIGSVMLLTLPASLPGDTQAALQTNAGSIDALFIFGGTGAVSTAVELAAKAAAGVF